ncbi:hypothetical protein COLO4_02793 [Corchorus olitorius]|uniref:Uncharacterized protein n=1 Tax=Corchorus olitorius TaxID=93759 RepID=A0A1R3L0D9_9ROSI|nr:hypothetical protein COLO4_02793 [Corchorus olitorius]
MRTTSGSGSRLRQQHLSRPSLAWEADATPCCIACKTE